MARFRWLTPMRFIVVNAIVWWIIQVISKPSLDSYGDMIEVYAWAQHWLLGSSKHPQFLPWVVHIWYFVAPESVASYYALSALNLALGMVGIAALGRAAGLDQRQVLIALAVQALAFPYLTLAGKLNMNAILLVMWPWTAHAFLRLTQNKGRAQLLWAVWLALVSAAAIMSKYYSVVLLISLLGASLMPQLRRLWRGPAPYVFLAFLIVMLMPHIYWLNEHRDALGYASEQGSDGVNIRQLVKFALTPIIYWPIPLIIGLGWLYSGSFRQRVKALVRMQDGDEVLWFCTVGPLFVTVCFGVSGFAELSQPWGIPIGFAYTLLMLRNRTDLDSRADNLPQSYRFIWPAFLFLAVVYSIINAYNGKTWHYMPGSESSAAILNSWTERHPNGPALSWTASGSKAARIAFYAAPDQSIEALPKLPDQLPSYYPDRPTWKTEAGVIVCGVRFKSASSSDEACLKTAESWAASHGLHSSTLRTSVARVGRRFPLELPFAVTVVYVWP